MKTSATAACGLGGALALTALLLGGCPAPPSPGASPPSAGGAPERRAGETPPAEERDVGAAPDAEGRRVASPGEAGVEVELERSGDTARTVSGDDGLVVTVVSASGIGSATLRRVGATWPRVTVVLAGFEMLEQFSLDAGGAVEQGSLAQPGAHEITRTDRGVEVRLPALQDADEAVTLRWIDAFR